MYSPRRLFLWLAILPAASAIQSWGSLLAADRAPIAGAAPALHAAKDAAAPQTVRGRVTAEGRGLAGVLVSDGSRVAGTDAEGNYELATGTGSGPFIFVTTPSGYWTDAFYIRLGQAQAAGRADFTLQPVRQPERFDFVFITDMHLENRTWGVAKCQASIREINQLQPAPAFIWAQGDICLQGHAGKDYLECIRLANMPVRNGAGNHEMMLSHRDPRDDFYELFGPAYYSFDWGGVHCVVLDGNRPVPGGSEKDYRDVWGAVDGSELSWLQADLAAQPKSKPIIVGIHIPIVTTLPQRRGKDPRETPYWAVTNADLLTDLFARHGVRLVLQGHMHENERTTVKGVEYVTSISLSGRWYHAGAAMERGVDNSPRGYRIVSVDRGRITHRYHSSAESHVDRQGEFGGLKEPVRAGQQVALVFNCFDAPNGSTAEVRIDRQNWQPMEAFEAVSEHEGTKMPHHFRLVVGTEKLTPGRHALRVRVRFPDGSVVSHGDSLVIAEP